MKNGFPNKKEWDSIVDDAFSSDEIHFFSYDYEMKKQEMQKGITMKKNKKDNSEWEEVSFKVENTLSGKKKHNHFNSLIAAAAVVAIAVPSVSLAYSKIGANIEQVDTYENKLTIEAPTEAINIEQVDDYENKLTVEGINSETAEPVAFEVLKPVFTWLPDGLVYKDIDSPYGGKYKNENGGGMTPCFMRIPETGIEEDFLFSDSFEKYETDDREIFINYRVSYDEEAADSSNFGREVWIVFNNTKYVMQLAITDDISKEDVNKIAENIQLVHSDEEIAGVWKKPESYEGSTVNTLEGRYALSGIKKSLDEVELYKVGEAVEYADPFFGGHANFEITVTDARIQKNFDGIYTDGCGWYADYSDYMDENGNLLPSEREWIKFGNGRNTLDEVVETEMIDRSILVLDVSYTNLTDSEFDVCVCPPLDFYENGYLLPSGFAYNENGDNYSDNPRLTSDWGSHFAFTSDNKGGKNGIIVPPHETVTYQIAYEIEDRHIGNLFFAPEYFNLNPPVFDLRDVKAE